MTHRLATMTLVFICLSTGCDDGQKSPGVDGPRDAGEMGLGDVPVARDAVNRLDTAAGRMDSEVTPRDALPDTLDLGRDAAGMDSGDTGRPDARPADLRVDAVRDLAVVDGSSDAAVDASVDAAPCVGIDLPPPPVSVNGEEVCNYIDDDGDGLVDEGFRYQLLGEPMRLTRMPYRLGDKVEVVWNGQGFGVVWRTRELNDFDAVFVPIDERGCPLDEPVGHRALDGVILSTSLAFAGDHYALGFLHLLPPENLFGELFVQFLRRDGTPVGEPHAITPGVSDGRFHDIVPFGDNFAIYSESGEGTFLIMAPDGQIVQGPFGVLPWEQTGNFNNGIGMAYDGEGFGLAWESLSAEGGFEIRFTRFAPDGHVLTPPVVISPGETMVTHRSGIAWTGSHYAISFDTRNRTWLALLTPRGELEGDVILLGDAAPRLGFVTRNSRSGQQLVTAGFFGDADLLRLSLNGEVVERTSVLGGPFGGAPHGPFPILRGVREAGNDDMARYHKIFQYFGCEQE